MHFAGFVLFCEEATFRHEEVFHMHNVHLGALNNPHSIRLWTAKQHFNVNVSVGITEDSFIVHTSYRLVKTVTNIFFFLQKALPKLLTEFLAFCTCLAPRVVLSNYRSCVSDHLDRAFLNKRIEGCRLAA